MLHGDGQHRRCYRNYGELTLPNPSPAAKETHTGKNIRYPLAAAHMPESTAEIPFCHTKSYKSVMRITFLLIIM